MPKLPKDPIGSPSVDDVEIAVRVIGNRINKSVIRALARNENDGLDGLHMGPLLEAVVADVGPVVLTSVQKRVAELEAAQVVRSDLKPGERRGRAPRYTLDRTRLKYLYEISLAFALGEQEVDSDKDTPA